MIIIRKVTKEDANAITNIYNYYIEHTVITAEECLINSADILARVQQVQVSGLPWLVALDNEQLVGYVYASTWKGRSAYRFSVESSVYLTHSAQGRGIGTQLYKYLLAELRKLEVNAVIGGITLPNPASVSLHEKMGMTKVAHFPNIEYKFKQWLDVGYWQLNLRS